MKERILRVSFSSDLTPITHSTNYQSTSTEIREVRHEERFPSSFPLAGEEGSNLGGKGSPIPRLIALVLAMRVVLLSRKCPVVWWLGYCSRELRIAAGMVFLF